MDLLRVRNRRHPGVSELREELRRGRRKYRIDEAAERDREEASPRRRIDHVEVDAGSTHRTEAVIDPSRNANSPDAIDLEAVVTARLAADRDHLVLGERR